MVSVYGSVLSCDDKTDNLMVVGYVATPEAGAGVRGVWEMILAATTSCCVVAGDEPTRTLGLACCCPESDQCEPD
jgi:hypothetical protein